MAANLKPVTISASDMRVLLFWAEYGVGRAYGGSWEKEIIDIINRYRAGFSIGKPRFTKYGINSESEHRDKEPQP